MEVWKMLEILLLLAPSAASARAVRSCGAEVPSERLPGCEDHRHLAEHRERRSAMRTLPLRSEAKRETSSECHAQRQREVHSVARSFLHSQALP